MTFNNPQIQLMILAELENYNPDDSLKRFEKIVAQEMATDPPGSSRRSAYPRLAGELQAQLTTALRLARELYDENQRLRQEQKQAEKAVW